MQELYQEIVEFYSRAHPAAQLGILALLIAVLLFMFWREIRGRYRVAALRAERDELRERVLEIPELRGERTTLMARLDRLDQDLRAANEDRGRLHQELERERATLTTRDEELVHSREEQEALQTHFNRLQEIDADVWTRPVPAGTVPPRFVPRDERRTRFVAFLNLKGGVGKTTLTANLAGAYATGVIDQRPLRVLVLDLDYQGSLSNMCVCRPEVTDYRHARRTVGVLLDDSSQQQQSRTVVEPVLAPFGDGRNNAKVIVADEGLDHLDFRQQARFAALHHEVRFYFRFLLHDPFILNQFDFVFFDCPPRLTTSSINALVAADWIVIPTSLHRNDVDAVPRTLRWLASLRHLPTYEAQLAGVILNRTHDAGVAPDCLTIHENEQYENLLDSIQQYVPLGGAVLKNVVPSRAVVTRHSAGCIPLGTQPAGHALFGAVAVELYDRIMC